VRYTRRVTQGGGGRFGLNIALSLWTALCWGRKAWSNYNGGIAYVLIGALVAGEFAWRHGIVLPRAARAAHAARSGMNKVNEVDKVDKSDKVDEMDSVDGVEVA
jgi:hypothetical protein